MKKEEHLTATVHSVPSLCTSADVQIKDGGEQPIRQGKARPVRADHGEVATPYPIDTSQVLEAMMVRYAKSKRAQNVSFRKLVSWLKVGERATHYLHPYPAKLLPQIAHFFLAAENLTKQGDAVLDPFGGSGTVALEAMLAGRRGLYADVNPLAQLIARVKTTPISSEKLREAQMRMRQRYSTTSECDIKKPDVVNLEYWYSSLVITSLSCIRNAIEAEKVREIREFMLVAFSATCRKVSRADPRLSVPVRKKDGLDAIATEDQVFEIFEEQCQTNIRRMEALRRWTNGEQPIEVAKFVGNDARSLKQPANDTECGSVKLRKNSVALIVTSPPYAGAQKYIRASSLNLGWLGLAGADGLKPLENASIGREHLPKISYSKLTLTGVEQADRLIRRIHDINPLRAAIVSTYMNEMKEALKEMARVLRPGGHLILVIGNNEVCGFPFKSADYLTTVCEQYGLKTKLRLIDEIKSRGLMTKRNKTASVITREWVLLFHKPMEDR
ncbi:MAG: DNA methyltransferase [Burkholderiaceae bacterium]